MIYVHWWDNHDEYENTCNTREEIIELIRARLKKGSTGVYIQQIIEGTQLLDFETKLNSLAKEYNLRNNCLQVAKEYQDLEER